MEKSQKQAFIEQSAKKSYQEIYQGRVIRVFQEDVCLPSGHTHHNELIVHPGAVALIAVNDKKELLLVKQWRHAAKKVMIEVPAGTLEKDEPVLTCAQRELQEEVGYRANTITPLGGFYSSPGFCTEYIYLFLAEDLVYEPLQGEDSDSIDILYLPLEKALHMIDTQEIEDAKTLTALLLYLRYQQRNATKL